MKRVLLPILCILLLVLTTSAQEATPDDLIPELMREINLWRLNSGVEPLVYNSILEAMAASQADYLMTLPNITDFHAGRQGEYPRQRSQFPQFSWPTFGHPQRIIIGENAGLGSIRSAMNFWQNSELHTRTSLNPEYREVGVAARQRGDDVLFIVVFGARPNVLPALSDPEVGDLYLTSERNAWVGDWIGQVTRYRFLDANEEPFTDWNEWAHRVPLPELSSNSFFVQYEDASGNRVTTEVPIQPVWYLNPPQLAAANSETLEEISQATSEAIVDDLQTATASAPTNTPGPVGLFATNTPEGIAMAATDEEPASIFATSTPIAPVFATSTPIIEATSDTPTDVPPPSNTPRPPRFIRLVYSDVYFTLHNATGNDADVFDMRFANGDNSFSAFAWEAPMADLNISALPNNHCLQLGGFVSSTEVNPLTECSWIRSFVTISDGDFFWTSGEFDVFYQDERIATCSAEVSICEIEWDE